MGDDVVVRTVLAVLVGVVLGMLGLAIAARSTEHEPPAVQSVQRTLSPDPRGDIHVIDVRKADDAGEPGRVQGVLGWKFFDHTATEGGMSDDQLRFRFDSPARIHQVHVSVDMTDGSVGLAEYVVGRNVSGYGESKQGETPFTHVSWSRGTGHRDIDHTAFLGDGVEVGAGDFVGVAAWMAGEVPARTSPEVVILYEWL